MQNNNPISFKDADVIKRIFAYFIDALVVFLLVSLFKSFFHIENVSTNSASRIKDSINYALVFSFYSTIFASFKFKGKSIGKMLMGIRIVKIDYASVDFITLLNREILGKLFIERANLWLLFILSKTNILQTIIDGVSSNRISPFIWYLISLPWVMFISFVMMLNSKEHLSLHDKISGTMVVRKRS